MIDSHGKFVTLLTLMSSIWRNPTGPSGVSGLRYANAETFWPVVVWLALALYCMWAVILIFQNPGLQYDEALLVLGSVHMRNSPQELSLPHDPNTWICLFGRCFPLMTVRYVGAIKEYLCLPLFAAFGPRAEVIRLASMLLAVLGIWGIAKLIGEQVSPPAAAITACVIAMNPAYVDLTVFDNGTVAIWMGALGVLCLAMSYYLRRKTARAAFWLGTSMGLGIWARANFLWLLIAIFTATLIVLRSRIRLPLSHWAAMILGGVTGGAPFLAYQVISGGGTWAALRMFSAQSTVAKMLFPRLIMFSETLLSDSEHRAIWDGPPISNWQRWLFSIIVFVGCFVCLRARSEWGYSFSVWTRVVALSFLVLGAFLFLSRMQVAEHHLIVLVPLAAIVTAFGSLIIAARYRAGPAVAIGLALVYFSSAIYWQIAAVRGLWNSGGIGQWSDAVFVLAEYVEREYPTREIKILDWGLQNNLYVLSDGKIRSREFFQNASDEQSRHRPRWTEEIRQGGVFLMNGPANRQFPAASIGFLEALAVTRPSARRFTVSQRNGVPYAEIIEIAPNTIKSVREARSNSQ